MHVRISSLVRRMFSVIEFSAKGGCWWSVGTIFYKRFHILFARASCGGCACGAMWQLAAHEERLPLPPLPPGIRVFGGPVTDCWQRQTWRSMKRLQSLAGK